MHDEPLNKLDPSYRTLMIIGGVLTTLPLLIGAGVLIFAADDVVPPAIPAIAVLIAAVVLIFYLPFRRYRSRGYHMGEDRLRVVKGVLWHSDSVVPFSRVQHLDVEQQPLERLLGLARLVLHTAGTHNSSVVLPGLRHETAVELREAIRQHVKRESL